jgi:hypothetical protein
MRKPCGETFLKAHADQFFHILHFIKGDFHSYRCFLITVIEFFFPIRTGEIFIFNQKAAAPLIVLIIVKEKTRQIHKLMTDIICAF